MVAASRPLGVAFPREHHGDDDVMGGGASATAAETAVAERCARAPLCAEPRLHALFARVCARLCPWRALTTPLSWVPLGSKRRGVRPRQLSSKAAANAQERTEAGGKRKAGVDDTDVMGRDQSGRKRGKGSATPDINNATGTSSGAAREQAERGLRQTTALGGLKGDALRGAGVTGSPLDGSALEHDGTAATGCTQQARDPSSNEAASQTDVNTGGEDDGLNCARLPTALGISNQLHPDTRAQAVRDIRVAQLQQLSAEQVFDTLECRVQATRPYHAVASAPPPQEPLLGTDPAASDDRAIVAWLASMLVQLRQRARYRYDMLAKSGVPWHALFGVSQQTYDEARRLNRQINGLKSGRQSAQKRPAGTGDMPHTHRCHLCSKTGTCVRTAPADCAQDTDSVPMTNHRCNAKGGLSSRFHRHVDLIPGEDNASQFRANQAAALSRKGIVCKARRSTEEGGEGVA